MADFTTPGNTGNNDGGGHSEASSAAGGENRDVSNERDSFITQDATEAASPAPAAPATDDAEPGDQQDPEASPSKESGIGEDDVVEEEGNDESREDGEGNEEDLVAAILSGEDIVDASGNGAADVAVPAPTAESQADAAQDAANVESAPPMENGASGAEGDATANQGEASSGAPPSKTGNVGADDGAMTATESADGCDALGSENGAETEMSAASAGDAPKVPPDPGDDGRPPKVKRIDGIPAALLTGYAGSKAAPPPILPLPEEERTLNFKSGFHNPVGQGLPTLGKALRITKRWYWDPVQRQFVLLDGSSGVDSVRYLEPREVPVAVARFVQLCVEGRRVSNYRMLRRNEVDLFIEGPAKLSLPKVYHCGFDALYDAEMTLYGPGYYPETGILVGGTPVDVLDGTETLDEVLADVPFQNPASRANFLGLLIGALVMAAVGNLPLGVIRSNMPGVGKTLVARLIAAIIDGADLMTTSFSRNDSELEKRIGANLRQSLRVMCIDNAKGDGRDDIIESQVLERCVSDTILSTRLLGYSRLIKRRNDVIWILTANSPLLSPDLASRAAMIDLECKEDPSQRAYKYDHVVKVVLALRKRIVGELLGLIERWKAASCPLSSVRHRFGPWAKIVGGILEVGNIPDFLVNEFSSKATVTKDMVEIIEVLSSVNDPDHFTLDDILRVIESRKALPYIRKLGGLQARKTALGMLLQKFVGKPIVTDAFTLTLYRKGDPSAKKARFRLDLRPNDGAGEDAAQ